MWCLVPNKIYATLHIVFKDQSSYVSTISDIHSFLLKYGISQATIQPEFTDDIETVTSEHKEIVSATGLEEVTTTPGEQVVSGNTMAIKEVSGTETMRKSSCRLSCPTESCFKKRCCISKEKCANNINILYGDI